MMHRHRDPLLWCIIAVMHHRYDVSTMHQERYTWLVICDILLVWCMYDVMRYRVMNVDEWMMSVNAWMLMNKWWVLMMDEWWMLMDEWWINDAGWWMYDERIWMLSNELSVVMNDACWWIYDACWMMHYALMNLWCVMQWCMRNR